MKNLLASLTLVLLLASCQKSIDLPQTTDDSVSASSKNSVSVAASQVPAAVMNAFKEKYPTAGGEIQWEHEDGNTYKVKFFIGTQRWQAIFTATGGFVSEKKI
jgi:hypothetical protein